MNTEQLYAAGMAAELPDCPCCKGAGLFKQEVGKMFHGKCPVCDGTGRKGGELAIKLHKALKAELEHHWQLYNEGERAIREHRATTHTRYMQTVNAAAISRIAGYLGVE